MNIPVFPAPAQQNSSPRNHWQHFGLTMEALAEGRPADAWRLLNSVRYSPILPSKAIEDAEKLIRAALDSAVGMVIEHPSDYLRRPPVGETLPPLRRIDAGRKQLKASPYELVLPPVTGNANDFSFISDATRHSAFSGPIPALSLRLVFTISDDVAAERLAERLTRCQRELDRLFAFSVCIFAPAGVRRPQIPMRCEWHEGLPWHRPRDEQLALLTGSADVLLFLPPQALGDPFLFERVVRYMALSNTLCLMLAYLPLHSDTTTPPQNRTVLADQLVQAPMQGEAAAFRLLETLDFAVSATQFRRLGGFDPRFQTEFFACREIAFRFFNMGLYFVPLAVRADPVAGQVAPDNQADRDLYAALSPHPLDRKHQGRFEVPKVSIYIPAYRAARYLRDAIDGVLAQDYEDLEICVADDGSPDATVRILESYASEPRVRWATGANGGIGHASNRAIRMTRGLYIGQLDSDDRLKPGAVRQLAEYLDNNPNVGCVYGSCERIGPNGDFRQNEYSFPEFSREKMMLTSIAHHFRMFRRQVWERTEGFREDIANAVDYDIFLKMSEVSEFHHIDKILYQRRWHGANTSSINEGLQTQNTYRVQNDALARLGLDRHWRVHVPDPAKPREVTYRRKGAGHRAFFWPDYSQANPYQRLLYRNAGKHGEILGGDIDAALRAVHAVEPGDTGQITFHLHWLNQIYEDAGTAGEAADRAQEFVEKLRRFRSCSGRLVWTIHNVVTHDLPFPQVARRLAQAIVELADAVHVHTHASLPEIEAHFPIPRHKLHALRHGAYIGAFADFVDRERARRELLLSKDDEIMIFVGQIRPCKGINTLISAFRTLAAERPRLRLILAGSGPVDPLLAESGLSDEQRSRITVYNRSVDDMELQLFLRAADVGVFPYRNILTPGSLLLALGFGLPVVIPEYGMTREILHDGRCGALYPPSEGQDHLLSAVRGVFSRFDAGERDAMSAAARARASVETWEDIGPLLFGLKE